MSLDSLSAEYSRWLRHSPVPAGLSADDLLAEILAALDSGDSALVPAPATDFGRQELARAAGWLRAFLVRWESVA